MNQHTQKAKEWLDHRYSRDREGGYLAHQPIHGLRTSHAEPNFILRFARTFRLLELLHNLEFDSVLDVGGGEGYLAALVRDVYGRTTVHSSDLSAQACQRAGEIFDIRGVAADSTSLPFADQSYDVVLCSEVIEHLSRPGRAIAELARIARKYVVISTAEFCPAGELERALRGLTLDRSYPHSEVNWFTADDFRGLLGTTVFSAQYRNLEHLLPAVDGTREQVEKILTLLTSSNTLDVDHAGVIVISPRHGAPAPDMASRSSFAHRRRILNRLLDPPASTKPRFDSRSMEELVSRLRCLECSSGVAIHADGASLRCTACATAYDVSDGVPSMFVATPNEPAPQGLEDACVALLGAGNPSGERRVRQVIRRLHNNEGRHHGERMQKLATQALRLLWLWKRNEPVASKVSRLFGRLTGRRPVGYDDVQRALLGGAQ
jgi:ubiquinone/menaquinone biosynthesis C-methylase UbiE/uncharacterized protein YbaR (Trm112 family)